MAELIAEAEPDKVRQEKMRSVVGKKREGLDVAGTKLLGDKDWLNREPWRMLSSRGWEDSEALILLIELEFTNPFAPYELKYSNKAFDAALNAIASLIGRAAGDIERLGRTIQEALKSHRQIPWKTIVFGSLGAALVLGIGGWVAAPAVGQVLGGLMGLYGAAATSYGLALLGGGSLAAGGLGMAGGMWLVTGAGVLIGGGAGAFGSIKLLELLNTQTVRTEVIKLQVYYKEVVLRYRPFERDKVINGLTQNLEALDREIEDEKRLNELDSSRVREREEKREALKTGLDWMKKISNGSCE
jgi:hypothetical protein